MFLITPLAIFTILYVNFDKIEANRDETFVRRFSSLIAEFDQNRGFKCLLYYPLFTIKRLVFAIAQIYLNDFPIAQVSLNLAFAVLGLIYMIIVRPFRLKLIQISNTVTEVLICGIFTEVLIMNCKKDILSEDRVLGC